MIYFVYRTSESCCRCFIDIIVIQFYLVDSFLNSLFDLKKKSLCSVYFHLCSVSCYTDQTWFFNALTFARSRGRCWKQRPKAVVFNTFQGAFRMLMHWKKNIMFDRYFCIKTENICYVSRYFLHYFVSPFYRCLANVISTDYARSRAGQYTSPNSSKSVAPVRSYWKLRSRALTARELPCHMRIHGFSPVNARLLITCDTAFYATICIQTHVLYLRKPQQIKNLNLNIMNKWNEPSTNEKKMQRAATRPPKEQTRPQPPP